MKPNVRENMTPIINRLTVGGKFAEGIVLDKATCCYLAKTLEALAGFTDAQCELDEIAEAERYYWRAWGKEMLKCLAAVVFVAIVLVLLAL